MNRIFLNTISVQKRLFNIDLCNTIIIVRNLNNFKISNMYLYFDKETSNFMHIRGISAITIKNSKNGVISYCNMIGNTNKRKYRTLKEKRIKNV